MSKTLKFVVVTMGAALVLALLIVGDQYRQSVEYGEFIALVEESEGVMIRHRQFGESLFSEPLSGDTWVRAWRDYGEDALNSSARLTVLRDDLESQWILPFHSSLLKAREEYAGHMGAWIRAYNEQYEYSQYLKADTAAEPPTFGAEISTTWALAGKASAEAIPSLFKRDFPSVQQRIFSD